MSKIQDFDKNILNESETLILKSVEKYNQKNQNKIFIEQEKRQITIQDINYELIIKYDNNFPQYLKDAQISFKSKQKKEENGCIFDFENISLKDIYQQQEIEYIYHNNDNFLDEIKNYCFQYYQIQQNKMRQSWILSLFLNLLSQIGPSLFVLIIHYSMLILDIMYFDQNNLSKQHLLFFNKIQNQLKDEKLIDQPFLQLYYIILEKLCQLTNNINLQIILFKQISLIFQFFTIFKPIQQIIESIYKDKKGEQVNSKSFANHITLLCISAPSIFDQSVIFADFEGILNTGLFLQLLKYLLDDQNYSSLMAIIILTLQLQAQTDSLAQSTPHMIIAYYIYYKIYNKINRKIESQSTSITQINFSMYLYIFIYMILVSFGTVIVFKYIVCYWFIPLQNQTALQQYTRLMFQWQRNRDIYQEENINQHSILILAVKKVFKLSNIDILEEFRKQNSNIFKDDFFSYGIVSQGIFSLGIFSKGLISIGMSTQGLFDIGILCFGVQSIYHFIFKKQIPSQINQFDNRKILIHILRCLQAQFILQGNNIISQNPRTELLLIIILQIILYEDFSVFSLILSISVHSTDLLNYCNGSVTDCKAHQISIYFLLYCFHYYIVYALFLQLLGCQSNRSKQGFLYRIEKYLFIFYCFDIPVGSYKTLKEDFVVQKILKYHLAVKVLIGLIQNYLVE